VAHNHQLPRQSSIFAVVVALHVAVLCMLLAATRPAAMRSPSPNLQLVFVAPTMIITKGPDKESLARSRPSTRPRARPSPIKPNPATPSEAGPPIPPPIDWAAELDRVVGDSTAADTSRKPVDFGFPHASATPSSKPPEFGWSYAATHRVESLPRGGLLVNLNDNCVLVFNPLPFFFCARGKKPANGDLFQHMRDWPSRESWDIP
jgi:hypothetical protein